MRRILCWHVDIRYVGWGGGLTRGERSEIESLLRQDQNILAIKRCRQFTGFRLHRAKAIVDRLRAKMKEKEAQNEGQGTD